MKTAFSCNGVPWGQPPTVHKSQVQLTTVGEVVDDVAIPISVEPGLARTITSKVVAAREAVRNVEACVFRKAVVPKEVVILDVVWVPRVQAMKVFFLATQVDVVDTALFTAVSAVPTCTCRARAEKKVGRFICDNDVCDTCNSGE